MRSLLRLVASATGRFFSLLDHGILDMDGLRIRLKGFIRAAPGCSQYVTLPKIFGTSKFRYLLSSNSIHKTKTRWEII
jgi:hypothetical protein